MGQCIIAGAVGVWILGVTGRCESRGLCRDDENGDAPVRFYANLANITPMSVGSMDVLYIYIYHNSL